MTNHASMAWLLQFDAFLLLSLAGPNMFMWTYPSNILLFCGCPCFWASKMPRGHKGPKHAGTSDTVTQWMYFGWMTKRSSDHATSSRNCKEMLWAGASLGPDPINWNLRARRPGTRYPKNSLLNLRQEGFQKHFIFSTMEHIFARIYILLSNFKKACWTQRHLLPQRKKVCCQNHKKSGCVTLMMAQHTFKVIWRRLRRRVVTDFFVANCGCLSSFLADGDEDGPWCWWFHSRKGLVYCMLIRMDFVFDLWFVFNFKTMQIAKNETHWTFPNRLCWIQRLRQLCKWHTPQTTNSILICFVGFSHHWASCFRVHLLAAIATTMSLKMVPTPGKDVKFFMCWVLHALIYMTSPMHLAL